MADWLDLVAINDVLARYADGVNRRDPEIWGSSWDEDGEWFLFGPESVTGRQAIVEAWKEAIGGFPFVTMFASQGTVQIEGDRASGTSYTNEIARTADGRELRVTGRYTDRYVKRDGCWGFAFRRFEQLHQQQI